MRRLLSPGTLTLLLIAAACFGPKHSGSATVLTFPNNSWTAGAPAAGQTVSQTFNSTGVDVTIAVNNNGASASGATWAAGYPTINSTQATGGYTGVNGLQLYATATSSTSAYILTTVSFSSPVTNLTLEIWDVDKSAGQFVDKITAIQGLSDTGTTVAPSGVTSAVAGYNSITGSGLSYVVTGTSGATNTTNQGTVNVSFTGPVTQFSFKWSNADPGLGGQAIGLGQITFTVVPEASPLSAIGALISAVLLTHAAARRNRKRGQQ